MSDFTELERAVLVAICDDYPTIGPTLRTLLDGARVTKREPSPLGFFTSLRVAEGAPKLDWPEGLINGPNVEVAISDRILPMGFWLFVGYGRPTMLEGWQNDTPTGESLDLRTVNLADLRWRERTL